MHISSMSMCRSASKGKGKGLLFRGRVPVSNLDIEDIEDGTCKCVCVFVLSMCVAHCLHVRLVITFNHGMICDALVLVGKCYLIPHNTDH